MEPYLSELRVFSFGRIPQGWLPCNGQLMPLNQYQALFALLGTQYGGNGTTNFALPNLQGRVMINAGNGGGNSYTYGSNGGVETVALTIAQMPGHLHVANAQAANATTAVASGNNNLYLAQPVVANGSQQVNMYVTASPNPQLTLASAQISTVGAGAPHDNMPPYNVLNVCICINGIFPSRN